MILGNLRPIRCVSDYNAPPLSAVVQIGNSDVADGLFRLDRGAHVSSQRHLLDNSAWSAYLSSVARLLGWSFADRQ
jgi:hypothetical protein